VNVAGPILKRMLTPPVRVAMTDDRKDYTGAEVAIGAWHAASAIDRVCRSDTVGLLLPTSGAFPIAALAAWQLGKTIVPLNYLLKPEELQYVIDDCGCDTIVTVGPMLEFLGHTPRVENLIRLDGDVSFKGVPRPRLVPSRKDDDLAALLYTSGPSGTPKGVMLTPGTLRAHIAQVRRGVGLDTSDRLFGVLPQFHSFGMTVLTLMPLAVGIRAVYMARFEPRKVVRAISEHRPTMMVAIPSMYNALLQVKKAEPADFESLRLIISGGEPLPADVAERFQERFGKTILEGYGLTETSPVTNVVLPDHFKPASVGKPLPGIEQVILDPASGETLPPDTDGELRIKGPNVMKGYYNLPDLTAEVFDEKGYFKTGDMAQIDAEGRLSITGRIKEMLIVGGENVFPREIEEVLNSHPSVHDSGVVGETDPMRGEAPIAFVEAEEGATIDERELKAVCRDKLAGYKVPRRIVVLDELPRNPTGKIMRRALKELLKAETPA